MTHTTALGELPFDRDKPSGRSRWASASIRATRASPLGCLFPRSGPAGTYRLLRLRPSGSSPLKVASGNICKDVCIRLLFPFSCWLTLILFLVSPLHAADKVRAGFGSLASSHMVMYVAKEFGLFKKYSLDAEIVGHIPGAKAVVPLVSGDAQIIHAAGPPFVLGTLAGSDIVIFLGLINTMPFYLVVHRDVTSASQLKGKKVGVSTLGSSSDFSLRFGLKKLGIDPEKEVTILALGDSAIRSSALNNGTVHAGAYNLGEMLYLRRLGHRLLLDMATTGMEYQHTAVATTRSYLARNRRVVLNYSKAIIDGINQMKSRKEDTLRLMAKHLRVDDRESLEAQYEENVNKLFSKKPYPTVSGVKTILDNIALKDERARHARAEQFVELGIVRELDESGFIDNLSR